MVILVNIILLVYIMSFFLKVQREIKNKCKKNIIFILIIGMMIINLLALLEV